jgi:osmotically-inducible protein OsmY
MGFTLKSKLLAAALVCAVSGFGYRVEAQTRSEPDQSDSGVVSALANSSVTKSEQLRNRVVTAMHVDPYLLDEHIEVTVAKGVIVLRGFVLSAWDLREAVRVARKVAGDTPVVDELSIKEGGR